MNHCVQKDQSSAHLNSGLKNSQEIIFARNQTPRLWAGSVRCCFYRNPCRACWRECLIKDNKRFIHWHDIYLSLQLSKYWHQGWSHGAGVTWFLSVWQGFLIKPNFTLKSTESFNIRHFLLLGLKSTQIFHWKSFLSNSFCVRSRLICGLPLPFIWILQRKY